ncbi:MAG: HEAT repeat domain-containing protein [Elusimicrobia bacterium]|nr:HEAT repeat domain-containing protein [Elusimicrobiota bacterium]
MTKKFTQEWELALFTPLLQKIEPDKRDWLLKKMKNIETIPHEDREKILQLLASAHESVLSSSSIYRINKDLQTLMNLHVRTAEEPLENREALKNRLSEVEDIGLFLRNLTLIYNHPNGPMNENFAKKYDEVDRKKNRLKYAYAVNKMDATVKEVGMAPPNDPPYLDLDPFDKIKIVGQYKNLKKELSTFKNDMSSAFNMGTKGPDVIKPGDPSESAWKNHETTILKLKTEIKEIERVHPQVVKPQSKRPLGPRDPRTYILTKSGEISKNSKLPSLFAGLLAGTVIPLSNSYVQVIPELSQDKFFPLWLLILLVPIAFTLVYLIIRGLKILKFSRMESMELRRELHSDSWRNRQLAIKTMINRNQGAMILTELLQIAEYDKDPRVRVQTIEAFGQMKSSSAVDILIRILRNSQEETLEAAVKALGEIGDPKATEPLMELALKKGDLLEDILYSLLQIGAPESLKRLGQEVEKELIEYIRDEDEDSTTISDIFMDYYEEIVDQEEQPTGKVFESIQTIFSQVTHPNALKLLNATLKILAEDEDKKSYTTFTQVGKVLVPTTHYQDVDADETMEMAEEVLEVEDETQEKIEEMDATQFRRVFGKHFPNQQDLLQTALQDPERRIPILLSIGLTPEALKSQVTTATQKW